MAFISDDQRKAVFARLKGGSIGSTPKWVFKPKQPTSKPTTNLYTAPNANHQNIPATRPKVGGGLTPFTDYRYTFRKDIGLSSLSNTLTAYSSAKLPQFNLLKPLLGWDPPSYTAFLFEHTLFEGLIGNSIVETVINTAIDGSRESLFGGGLYGLITDPPGY